MNRPQTSFPRVVIIGGGFAGLAAARGLEEQELQVFLIDKHNYHTFQPLLYQVATGELEPDNISNILTSKLALNECYVLKEMDTL